MVWITERVSSRRTSPFFFFFRARGAGGIPNPVSNYYLRATDGVSFTGSEALPLTDAVLQGY